ncbi:hypothetical protein F8M41_013604 [Gigaspora margarita]|uniref:Uncharacterized protein n=1 Tax=Gigaspora margarita TaxID=4874 RepID=A0A8H4AS23_GIGMA|nr:hypothetical protein F8M41_013604 [Gigaspora margarita]
MMSSGIDESHDMVNRQVKNKETRNSKNVNQLMNIKKSISEKRYKTTQAVRLEDPLDDVRNLFESGHSYQSSIGNKENKHKAPNNKRVSISTNIFHCYQNETNIKNNYSNDKDEYQVSTYYQRPVEIDRHNKISIIKRKKKAETHHRNVEQNYRSYGLVPCYKNELGVKNELDKRKISIESCLKKNKLNKDKLKSEELTKYHGVLEAVSNSWKEKVKLLKSQANFIRKEKNLLKRKGNASRGGKVYETDLDDMCRSWLLRIKNHLKSESVKCIKDEQSNCAMDRSSNKNLTPKINGKDNKKINAVGKFMGRIEKPDTKKWVSKDNVIKPTRHKEGKEKFISKVTT